LIGTTRHFWWNHTRDAEPLKRLPDSERLARLESKGFRETAEYGDDNREALSNAEARALAAVVDVGSHTRFHPILPQCDVDRARDEVGTSKMELEHLVGRPCRHFSYPNGDFSQRDRELVQAAGYVSARTIQPGWNGADTDLFALRVVGAPDDSSVNRLAAAAVTLFVKRLLTTREWSLARASHQRPAPGQAA